MMRLLVCISLALTCVAAEYECTPGTYFKMNCNTCSCSDDGRIMACTDMACPPKENSNIIRIDSAQENNKQECTPGSIYKDYCNTCTCSADGTAFACTMMYCDKNIWNKDGTVKDPALIYNSQNENKEVCKAGATFNEYCNLCTCSKDGMNYVCTLMYCDKNVWNKDGTRKNPGLTLKSQNENKEVCKAGTTFNDYCNVCSCSNDGTFYICTMMYCDKNVWNKDGSIKNSAVTQSIQTENDQKQVCNAGAIFNDYCNVCSCSNDGTFYVCSMMNCDKNVWNKDGSLKKTALSQKSLTETKQVCSPGTEFKDFCNSCTCLDDGVTAACTALFCDHNIWNKDGSRKDLALIEKFHDENQQVCTPGTTFNDYCNVCSCLADGSNFYCTIMFCDKNIWNKDGSLKHVSTAITQKLQNENKQVCTPGSTFKDYCNVCACLDDGSNFFCTLMFCDENVWNKDGTLKGHALTQKSQNGNYCEPGKTFSPDDCNTCICNKYGTEAACTYKICLGNFKSMYEVTNEENWGPLYKQGDACAPGKTFYSECNQCVCMEGGRSAFCTLMSCQRSP